MKARTAALIFGFLTVLGVSGYVAYKFVPGFRGLFATNETNDEEVKRGQAAALKNFAPPPADAGFPQWRGADRTGVAPAGSFRTDWDKNPPRQLWRQSVGGGYGSCAVVGGRLYVQDKQGDRDRVVCLDALTGKPVWEHAYPAGPAGKDGSYAIGPRSTPTVVGNEVFAVGGDGQLLALEVAGDSPKARWQSHLLKDFSAELPQWGVACSPLVLNDLVVVQPGGNGAAVVAFDRATGAVKWKAGSNTPGYSSPVAATVFGVETVFAFMGDALLLVRAGDGKVMSEFAWTTMHRGNIATPLVVDGEYVFVSSAYDKGCALHRLEKRGDEIALVKVYENPKGGFPGRRFGFANHLSTSVYKDKHLFGVDGTRGQGGLRCVEFMTGKAVPEWEALEVGQANLILAGEHLIVQRDAGDVLLVEANVKEFVQVGKLPKVLTGKNNWATPTLVNGLLYLRDEEKVVCYDLRPEEARREKP